MAKPGTDRDGTMVEKQSGKKSKDKISPFTKTPKLDRSELLGKEMKPKSSMKRKLPFTVSPPRHEERDSDTDKDGPDKKKVKKETGSKKSTPVNIFGYPLSERKQMALLMQMTARDNSPDTTPNHPSQATPVQKKIPSTSSRQKDKVNKRNERGETPLHMAAIRGDAKQVKELISLGADVNVKDFAGWTPLHEACNLGYYDVAKVLIAAGAEVNTQGLDDDTPLHDASSSGHKDIVKLLLRHGGNAFQANNRGERPVDVADSKELEQLLKGEMPLSDEEDSSSESEDPLSINPSSVDDNMEYSDAEKDSDSKQPHPNKAPPCVSGLDEYEFKDEEEEEDLSKALNDRHILRRELRQREKEEKERNNVMAKHEKNDQPSVCKSKKQKPSRIPLFCSSESSGDETPQEKKISSPTCSLAAAAECHKTEVRTKKELSLAAEHKEKGKVKKKFKNQSKNKENQELKEDGKENSKVTFFSSAPVLETSERTREEDSFKMSFSPKDDSSVHLFHLPSVKSPKLNHSLADKQSAPLKQENAKMCLSTGVPESPLQVDTVKYDHYAEADNTTESSSSKGFKHKEKSKHHQKDSSIDVEDENSSSCKDDNLGTSLDSSEGALRKTDKEGKVVKKHKLKHKEKDKHRREYDGEKEKHRQRDLKKEGHRNLEFDREFWKENFFKSDENDEPLLGKTETSETGTPQKITEMLPIKEERAVKDKHVSKDKRPKEDREKDKVPKKEKKENLCREEKGKELKTSEQEERTDSLVSERAPEETLYGVAAIKEEQDEQFSTEKETDHDQHDPQEKGAREKNEKRSPAKEKDTDKLDKKHSDKEKKVKSEHNFSDKPESHNCTDKWREREKTSSSHSCGERTHKESDKMKPILSMKKPDENKRSKDKLERKHEKEKQEKERSMGESKDKEKIGTDKKGKVSEKGVDLSKPDRYKEKDKEHEKKKKDKIKDVTSSSNLKIQEEKKSSVLETSKVYHDKALSSKLKDDGLKTPEKDRRENDRDIERYKERDKYKDKSQPPKANKTKTNELEADKAKSKPLSAPKDTRPKEKRLVNDDLMQTSFERMLSLKDQEIEQRHRKHKEKIKQKERERMRHKPGSDLNKLKNKDRLRNSPAELSNSKELLRSKSSEVSETLTREKTLKEATGARSFSLDAKNLPNAGKIGFGLENSLTRSPKPENEKSGLISRSVSMISVASSEDSCQAAVMTPRPMTEYDSDFTLEGSDSQLSFSQALSVTHSKSPVITDRETEGLFDVTQRGKTSLPSKQPPPYLRSPSAEDPKPSAPDGRVLVEDRRYSAPADSSSEHLRSSLSESNLPPTQENQNSPCPAPPSLSNTSSMSEAPLDIGGEGIPCSSSSSTHHSLSVSPLPVPNSSDSRSVDSDETTGSQNINPVEPDCIQQTAQEMERPYNAELLPDKDTTCPLTHDSQIENSSEKLTSDCPKTDCKYFPSVNAPGMLSTSLPAQRTLSSSLKASSDSSSEHQDIREMESSSLNFEILQKAEKDPVVVAEQEDQPKLIEDSHSSTDGKLEEQKTENATSDVSANLRADCNNSPGQLAPSCTIIQRIGNNATDNPTMNANTICEEVKDIQEDMETDPSSTKDTKARSGNESVNDSSRDQQLGQPESDLPKSLPTLETHCPDPEQKSEETTETAGSLENSSELAERAQTTNNTKQTKSVLEVKTEPVEEMNVDQETVQEKEQQQDESQRTANIQENSQACPNKVTSASCPQTGDKDLDISGAIKAKVRLSEDEDMQVHHPRKRKMLRVPQPVQANPVLQQAKEKTQQSLAAIVDSLKLDEIQPYQTERANPYYEFLHIRKKIEEKRKVLCSVIPQAPQYYDEYVTFNGSYLLDGNPLSKLCIPTITPPPSLPELLKELFKQQEVVRMKLRLQHSIEREKLIVSNEQEVLRVHYRAARTLANQTLPFSACTVLLDAEVYNMPQEAQADDGKTSVRDRFNARQFMSWLHDVDDKFDKLKTCLLMRQQHEAAALNAVQRLEWQLKLQELDPATYKSISIFEIPEFYVPLVDVNDDFELTPI
ncbi:ankyrin repeat domain-containing protein 12 isoform X2 [Amia ocellicauda]|uniref:ankyrin repeat domain-containing protein 12 isoform X2 n=1 Tax=Amia ocellicauda TaxID=2972642 RepID=UPI0034639C08